MTAVECRGVADCDCFHCSEVWNAAVETCAKVSEERVYPKLDRNGDLRLQDMWTVVTARIRSLLRVTRTSADERCCRQAIAHAEQLRMALDAEKEKS